MKARNNDMNEKRLTTIINDLINEMKLLEKRVSILEKKTEPKSSLK